MRLLYLEKLTPEAEHRLSGVGDSELWEPIKADIEHGRAQLFQCPDDTFLVLRIEGSEMVIVAIVGTHGIEIMQTVVDIARENRLKSVRFHTSRPGMARFLKKFQPKLLEKVYRVTV